jgi:hypothetical protein
MTAAAAARIRRIAARDIEERREREASRPITLPVPTLPKRTKAELDRLYSDDEHHEWVRR